MAGMEEMMTTCRTISTMPWEDIRGWKISETKVSLSWNSYMVILTTQGLYQLLFASGIKYVTSSTCCETIIWHFYEGTLTLIAKILFIGIHVFKISCYFVSVTIDFIISLAYAIN